MINMTEDYKFKITLTGGAVSITEMEISPDTAAKIIRLLLPVSAEPTSVSNAVERTAQNEVDGMTAKQFMADKQPKSDMERLTCLGYYLTHFRDTAAFKTVDLTHLNTEAALPKMTNPSATARNAVEQQYLALAGGGRKQITQRGEALVQALPDRVAVKDALEQYQMHGNKRKTSAKKSKRVSKK